MKKLWDENGTTVEGRRLKDYIADQYQSLFISRADANVEEVTHCIHEWITPAMNRILDAPFSGDEVRKTLDCISDLKAPGADDILAVFYKKF